MMVIWIQVISMISVEYVTERGIHVDGSREHTARTTYLMVGMIPRPSMKTLYHVKFHMK